MHCMRQASPKVRPQTQTKSCSVAPSNPCESQHVVPHNRVQNSLVSDAFVSTSNYGPQLFEAKKSGVSHPACMDCLECIVHVVGMILQEATNPDTGEDAFQNIKPKICEHCDALVVAGTIELHGQSWRQISMLCIHGVDHNGQALASVTGGRTDHTRAQYDMASSISVNDAVEYLHWDRREAVDCLRRAFHIRS